jgi:hypothetical protein
MWSCRIWWKEVGNFLMASASSSPFRLDQLRFFWLNVNLIDEKYKFYWFMIISMSKTSPSELFDNN